MCKVRKQNDSFENDLATSKYILKQQSFPLVIVCQSWQDSWEIPKGTD
jgi:hypothetical protein